MKMKWYNFWCNIHLTILLVIEAGYIWFYLQRYNFEFFAHELLIFIYICYVINSMEKKKKGSLVHIVIILIFEIIVAADYVVYNKNLTMFNVDAVLSFIFNFIVLLFIWFLPNYVYFKKRKDVFIN